MREIEIVYTEEKPAMPEKSIHERLKVIEDKLGIEPEQEESTEGDNGSSEDEPNPDDEPATHSHHRKRARKK